MSHSFHGNRRVAFFGGSFDPPHLGHLAVARAARDALKLDTVLFAPVGTQPLKRNPDREKSAAGFEDRVAMTRLAIAGETGFAISLADAPKPFREPNYTFDTLTSLRAALSLSDDLFCLMGADSFFSLRQWHRAAEIPFIAPLIVASRPGGSPVRQLEALKSVMPDGLYIEPSTSGLENPSIHSFILRNATGGSAPFFVLPGLDIEISASQIREQVRASSEMMADRQRLLPASVLEFIRTNGLYR